MNDKRLSIIIPHYNSVELLRKLIDSIPQREEIQVIVVDDNSKEDITEIKKYAEHRQIEFYINDSSTHSAGRCRNIGLQHAIGEWLLFADADDFFLEGMWEKISPYLKQEEFDIVYFTATSISLSDGTESSRHVRNSNLIHNYVVSPTRENEIWLRYRYVEPWSKLIRGNMVRVNKILFDETRVSNDVMFSMKCATCAKKIAVSEDVFYCITKSGGTLTTSKTKEDVRSRLKTDVKKYHYLKKNVDRDAWKQLDLRGDRYVRPFVRYGMGKREVIWAWVYILTHGVRPCLSRQVTMKNVIPKIIGRIWKKN